LFSIETFKPTSINNIEHQRERERQRLREEEERRKRLLVKKDHYQQPIPISSVHKFEQLILDTNNDEPSHSNKTKTPISIINKPLARTSIPNQNEENETLTSKKIVVKKRSTILVSFLD